MRNTLLNLSDKLPLTCSRSGNCCHGNKVLLNPWELAILAQKKGISSREFRDQHTEWCGTRLLFDGKKGYNGKKACNQYVDGVGCSLHVARPLACRLFPIGRQIQNGETVYMHQGETFPCLEGCKEVLNLPYQTVAEYLIDQQTEKWEIAQNTYIEIMQLLADIAFELLLDGGLAESGDKTTLAQWRLMATESPEKLANRIGQHWLDLLTIPDLKVDIKEPILFCEQHLQLLQLTLQQMLENARELEQIREITLLSMALAILLATAIGAEPELLVSHWIEIAKNNGAQE